jgi:very-short-patch-repair endonuclease
MLLGSFIADVLCIDERLVPELEGVRLEDSVEADIE